MEKEGKVSTVDILIENSVSLQRVLTEVAISLKALNEKLDSLLNIFEDAAKTFKEKKPEENNSGKEIAGKLDEINDQNRIIAKGVMLLEQAVRTQDDEETPHFQLKPRPLPEFKT